jgi:hypothetical protein
MDTTCEGAQKIGIWMLLHLCPLTRIGAPQDGWQWVTVGNDGRPVTNARHQITVFMTCIYSRVEAVTQPACDKAARGCVKVFLKVLIGAAVHDDIARWLQIGNLFCGHETGAWLILQVAMREMSGRLPPY